MLQQLTRALSVENMSDKIQSLADAFNRAYWKATSTSDVQDYFHAALMARQLVLELGVKGVLHDKLLDPEYPNKYTLEK